MKCDPTLRALVEPDLFDLVPEYVRKRKSEFAQISTLIQQGDFTTIQSIGHKLQGNAALFGLDWLGQKGAELEAAARERLESRVLQLSQKMMEHLDKVEFVQQD